MFPLILPTTIRLLRRDAPQKREVRSLPERY